MIKSFRDRLTESNWHRQRVTGFPGHLLKAARRKRGPLEDAVELKDLRIPPGEILKEEFLDPLGITPYALAKGIIVDPPRIDAIIKGRRKITADTAIRLSRFFGTTPAFWLNMQSRYDLETLIEPAFVTPKDRNLN